MLNHVVFILRIGLRSDKDKTKMSQISGILKILKMRLTLSVPGDAITIDTNLDFISSSDKYITQHLEIALVMM